jgi:hypothetical protein
MKLEAVIVCVNYSDFLSHTLPSTKNQFDNLVVVTDLKDLETKKLCEYYNVKCIQTDVFYENGDTFNKGKGINEGLRHLDQNGWVLHIDADIYLPPQTRTILENLPLDSSKIYGADRLMCPSYEEWKLFESSPTPIQDSWIFVHLTRFPVGVRLCEYKTYHGGYEPIGYFQLWNPLVSNIFTYPNKHGFADRTDVLHCKKWPRAKRELLPEIIVIHLESESGFGLNWKGRTTAQFGPEIIMESPNLSTRIRNFLSQTLKRIRKVSFHYHSNPFKYLINKFFG